VKKWQREVIKRYEQLTAFDFMGKDEIHSDKTFWEKWDMNYSWFENVYADVQHVISPYNHLRPELGE